MDTAVSFRIEKDMLPAIRAVVLRRKVWTAVGGLAAWGAVNLLFWVLGWEDDQKLLESLPEPPLLLYVLLYGVGVIGATMVAMAIGGALRPRPSVIALEASAVGLVGVWNVAWPFLAIVALRRLGFEAGFGTTSLVLGLCQLAWSAREWRVYRRASAWESEAAGVSAEEHDRIKGHLAAFVKQDEDYFAGRIRGTVADRGFLSPGVRRAFRGQILDDMMILVAKRLDECLRIWKEEAAAAKYGAEPPKAKMVTEEGGKVLTLGELSVLALKEWAGLSPTELDIRRVVKKKKASVPLLEALLARDDPTLNLLALNALGALRKDPGAPAAAQRRLDHTLAAVRAAALDACRALRADGLHQRVIPMLRDNNALVRTAAAAYLAAFAVGAACEPLRSACRHEQDKAVARQMEKAAKACEKAVANPYAAP